MHIISRATKQQFSKSILVSIPILVAMTLFFTTIVPLMVVAQGGGENTSTHRILLLIDNSGSVLDGTGASEGKPTDPDNKRIRFAVFLSQYIRIFSGTTEVGVISFAGDAATVVPLTPVADWTLADLHAIETFSQTYEKKTDFKTALVAAHNQFLERGACNNQNQCSIVLFTDGIVYQADEKVVNAEIQSIHADNIQILPVILSANINEPGLSMDKKQKITDDLKETIRNWREKITDTPIITDVNSGNLPRLYHEILSPIGLNKPLDSLESITIGADENETIPFPVMPYQQIQHIRLFGDRPIIMTHWNLSPDFSSSIDNYWFDFSGDALTATINAPPSTTIFYGVNNSQDKIRLKAQFNPDRQIAGQPISLMAWLVGGVTIITDSNRFDVVALMDNGTRYQLHQQPDGYFETTITATNRITGSHLITITGTSLNIQDFNIIPLIKTLRVDIAPRLQNIEAIFLPSSSITVPVLITVTVANALPATVPRLTMTFPHVEHIKLVANKSQGIFIGRVTANPGEKIQLQAILPQGVTATGLPYVEQRLIRNFVTGDLLFQTIIPRKISTEEPIILKAFVLRGGQVISDGNIQVQAILKPENISYTLTHNPDGYYTARIMPLVTSGAHTVTITSTVLSLGRTFWQQQQLEVVKMIPGLRMSATHPTISSSVKITVTVDNYATIAGRYTPTLGTANGQTFPLQIEGVGVFVATLPNSTLPEAGTTVRAVLTRGITSDGIYFPKRVVEQQIYAPVLNQKRFQYWQWAVVLLASVIIAWRFPIPEKNHVKNHAREIDKYAENMSKRDIDERTIAEAKDFAQQVWAVIEKFNGGKNV